MSAVKSAISIERGLFEEMDRLSKRLRVSRSRLFAQAAEEFLRRHNAEELVARLNRAYARPPTREERRFLQAARRSLRRVVEAW
jgi:metal-responsive CopG/Arc/MetJ family transcriptional regulator